MDGSKYRTPMLTGVQGADAAPVACWSCLGPVAPTALFCPTCAAVQPAGQLDHFSRLGLDRGFDVDPAALDRAYFERQRELHPDRFVTRTPRERALSQGQATAINDAYETLKDPLRRADYLLQLHGPVPSAAGMAGDMQLLSEALELREALADAGSAGVVKEIAGRARDEIEGCIDGLAAAFADDDPVRAVRLTTRLKYLRKLADDCRTRLSPG